MFLAIDVGNTQTTIGLYDVEGAFRHGWRMATGRTDTADELREKILGFLAMDGFGRADVTDAGVASVVPVLSRAWSRCLERLLGSAPLLVGPGTTAGMRVDMPDPTTLGADRVANAVAAREAYGDPVIVVDFGTATNIDVVDASGAYRGGVISPGLMLSAAALFERAAKLASVPVEAPGRTLGATTAEAVQSGLVVGAAAQAEGLVARIKAELSIEGAKVVGTGGLARTVARATELFDAVDDDLTLRGIRLIWLAEGGAR
ncbi:MAG: type III pantothenate kinase [Olsenella sp.]|nr:type III pantothenate kinase [Olsenella sp.]